MRAIARPSPVARGHATTTGYYVAATGQSSQTAATTGYYVATTGQSSQTAASTGYYVPTTGQSTETAASAGNYVSGTGQSSETEATPGYFVSSTGATAETEAAPGWYVSGLGATAPLEAQPGYYAAGYGATSETPYSAGVYTPAGASAEIPCPIGYSCVDGILSPITTTSFTLPSSPSDITPNFVGSLTLTIPPGNTIAEAVSLTAPDDGPSYQITGFPLGGANPGLFGVEGLYIGEDIPAGGTIDFSVLFTPTSPGLYPAELTIDTIAGPDPAFTFDLNPGSTQGIPEPASMAGLLSGLAGLGWVRRRLRRWRNGAGGRL